VSALSSRAIWSGLSGPVNDDWAKVVDVGECRSSDDEVVERRKETVAVVVDQPRFGRGLALGGATQRVGPQYRAGIVLGAVNSVGIASDGVNAGMCLQRHRKRQQELGVAAAAPSSANRHRRLAAREQDAGGRRRLSEIGALAAHAGMAPRTL